jgi:predicted amidohydrolase YtcJ
MQEESGSVNGSIADLAFVNGAVHTMDAASSRSQAVCVQGGRIVGIGTDDEVRPRLGPRTEVVDLRGRMLVPGFQDAHVHPVSSGVEMLQCDLHDLHDVDGYVEAVASYASAHPDREWILGGGWSMDVFAGGTPSKSLLDAIVPDRAVFLPNRDGHGAWVNSRALALAGITSDTPDPGDGRIERDPAGEPAGTLHEGAQRLVERIAPEPSEADVYAGLLRAQRYLHSLGITAWQDAIVEAGGAASAFDAYLAASERGELTARVVGALWWDRHRGLDQIEELEELRRRADAGRFRATSVKIMQDGIIENFTAATLTPYLDEHGQVTENAGLSFVEPRVLNAAVIELDARGFQVHFHALGDRAVRESLNAVEAARKTNGPNDHRHHLAHLQIVHPDDLPRFGRLGAVANAQALWAAHEDQMDRLTIPFIGPDRAGWQYPFASLVRAGATLAMGSDWSVSTPDPIDQIHVAVNRVMPGDYVYANNSREVFLPEERLDLQTALAGFTTGSAFVNHLDAETGSITLGKLADLAVVDRDLFDVPAQEIADAAVDLTYVEGRCVFDASDE